MAGTENQCIGVAEALGVDFEVKRIALREPWKSLSPYLGFERSSSFEPQMNAPWPDLVIAAGRKAISAARYIKRKNSGTFVTFIQDPRTRFHNFDLIAVPRHDPLRGNGVIVTEASPNRVSQKRLKEAENLFAPFSELPAPRIAVLIGGSSQAYDMTEEITRKLAYDLERVEGSLMITCSRRTGEINEKILRDTLDRDGHYFWSGKGDNPYMGILAWADTILVTADSASMISDACSTGKPVYMIDLEGGAKRIGALHDHLITSGVLKLFTGSFEPYTYEPLHDAELVAKEIQKCIQKS